jgi:hypothetical protein
VSAEFKFSVKVKMSLCLTKHDAMKEVRRSGCVDQSFIDLGTS